MQIEDGVHNYFGDGCANCATSKAVHPWSAVYHRRERTIPVVYGLCRRCSDRFRSGTQAMRRAMNVNIMEFLSLAIGPPQDGHLDHTFF